MPSDRTIVVERFRDEIGDWRLCVLSPFGGRVHAAWALALSARIRDEFGLESDAIWSDDGIIVHLPDADEPPRRGARAGRARRARGPGRARAVRLGAVRRALPRERRARAAAPARLPRQAHAAVAAAAEGAVAARGGQALRPVPDRARDLPRVPARRARPARRSSELLRGLHTRELSLVEVETQRASPFASSLLFDYVATYMYEGDTPNAERRAAALSLDRDLLRELLGQEELRELIDPDALAEVEADLQRAERAHAGGERRRAARRAARARRPDRRTRRRRARLEAVSAERMLGELERERRAVRMRIGGEERWIAAEDAGLYRDAFGAVPPGGLPEAFLEPVEEPLAAAGAPLRAHPRPVHDRATLAAATASTSGPVLRELERAGELVRGELRPGGTRARVVRPRRAAPAAARVARRAAQGGRAGRAAGAGALPAGLAGRRRRAAGRRRRRPAARGARAAPGPGAGARGLGARRAAAPRRALLAGLARPALRGRRARLGRRGRARAQLGPRGALLPRGRALARPAAVQGRPAVRAAARRDPRAAGARARRSGPTCWPTSSETEPRRAAGGALGPGLGGRGDQRRLRAAARAAAVARPARARRAAAASRAGAARARRRCRAAGR